jgi:hypothetical protein
MTDGTADDHEAIEDGTENRDVAERGLTRIGANPSRLCREVRMRTALGSRRPPRAAAGAKAGVD